MTVPVYDAPPVVVDGNNITVDWYRNSPTRIYRLLRTLTQQNLIGNKILRGRVNLTGSGFAIYEVSEGIFADGDPQVVAPLNEYPLVNAGRPVLANVKPLKDGFRSEIADETVAHNDMSQWTRKMKKLANSLIRQQDKMTLAAVASVVTQEQSTASTGGPWDAGNKSGDPFLTVGLAGAQVEELEMGYDTDTVIVTPTSFEYAISRAAVLDYMPRESAQNILQTNGNGVTIAGKTWWKTTHLPTGVQGYVLDSTMLGSQAWEALGGGYQGNPGDVDGGGIETKQIRYEDRDGFTVQARIVRAPMVQEPNCAVELTGIRSV